MSIWHCWTIPNRRLHNCVLRYAETILHDVSCLLFLYLKTIWDGRRAFLFLIILYYIRISTCASSYITADITSLISTRHVDGTLNLKLAKVPRRRHDQPERPLQTQLQLSPTKIRRMSESEITSQMLSRHPSHSQPLSVSSQFWTIITHSTFNLNDCAKGVSLPQPTQWTKCVVLLYHKRTLFQNNLLRCPYEYLTND